MMRSLSFHLSKTNLRYSSYIFLLAIMGNVFSEKPLKEIVRENQRLLKKSIRELEKEISNLKKQEQKLVADIKKMAKQNQMVINF